MKFQLSRLTVAIGLTLQSTVLFADTISVKSGVDVLSGFNNLWKPGATWNTGTPTATGAQILDKNVRLSVDVARSRTAIQEVQAYEIDRQDANYAVLTALGPLQQILKKETGAFTTVNGIPKEAYTGSVADKGNGLGNTNNNLGQLVNLVNAVRYPASTTPAKNAYNYPRPFRQMLDGQDLKSILQPSLVARVPATGQGDGGFPSGHTNAGYLAALSVAYVVPQQQADLVLRAGEMGYSRVLAGIHSPLDVIGGRMHATYYTIQGLLNNADLRRNAYQQAQSFFATQCGGTVSACYDSTDLNQRYTQYQTNKALYDKYTFANAFTAIGDTTLTPIVPDNAEVLIETRYPYLTANQRRDLLQTTSNARGGVLDNGLGYDTLNLYKAANGYGAFNQKTTINMNATDGGLSASDVWLNDISGQGQLEKTGTGSLTLVGRNTWSGGTQLLAGTLIGSNGSAFGQGAIFNQANLVLNHNTTESLANTMTGSGTLYKQGTGLLNYTGDGSGFTGTTRVQNGQLNVTNRLNGTTIVESSGTLQGAGKLQNLQVLQGGTIDLTQSLNRLSVSGDLTLNQGTLKVLTQANSATSSGIDVSGRTQINAANVLQVGLGSEYNLLSEYVILNSTNGVTGRFATVKSAYSFLTPQIGYTANTVTLQLLRNDQRFNSVAQTANQYQVANSIESLGLGNSLYNLVAKQSSDQARQSYNRLSGEGYASLAVNATQDLLATTDFVAAQKYQTQPYLWLNSYGRQFNNRAVDVSDSSYKNYGAVVGGELPLNNQSSLGLVLGQGKGTAKVADNGFTAKDNNSQLGLYGRYADENSNAIFGLFGRWGDVSVQRQINSTGLNSQANANLDVYSLQGFAEYGFKPTALPISPYARLAHVVTQTKSFQEQGADIANLYGTKSTNNMTFTTLGLKANYDFNLGSKPVTAQFGLGWQHALGDTQGQTTLQFNRASSYKVNGSEIAQDLAKVDVGVSTKLTNQLSFGLNYAGQFASQSHSNEGTLKLDYRF
ncbi:autotransporter domain-containing protein [Acinetobacter boissieri]|uniref:Autotransporter-associated beta strand repeat-containing protein n=1 Tax=Acinetobacter boissieri TaxID=1219383 RepID=A0A1G6GJC7_9GAMM|nr:autotransporter domain-containing protein [Acinetobacter boissieri]SDB82098.1 autotransporter-associated beta strand repeat-containing protein [Acinetobacter boissieri]